MVYVHVVCLFHHSLCVRVTLRALVSEPGFRGGGVPLVLAGVWLFAELSARRRWTGQPGPAIVRRARGLTEFVCECVRVCVCLLLMVLVLARLLRVLPPIEDRRP